MFDRPFFKRLIIGIGVVGGIVAAVGGLMQGLAAQDIKNTAAWKAILLYGGLLLVAVCVILLILSWKHDATKKTTWPDEALRTAATRLVAHLHERWFMLGRDFDKGYRVSLFMPQRSEGGDIQWRCVARTITPPEEAAVWKQVDDAQHRTKAGLVNLAVTSGTGVEVPGLPMIDRGDAEKLAAYLRNSCLTTELQDERTWPFATIRVRIARGRNAKVLCAIVVEREDGEPIALTTRKLDFTEKRGNVSRQHDPCEWEHQLVADVWATVRDD